jgi:hypothetical protein
LLDPVEAVIQYVTTMTWKAAHSVTVPYTSCVAWSQKSFSVEVDQMRWSFGYPDFGFPGNVPKFFFQLLLLCGQEYVAGYVPARSVFVVFQYQQGSHADGRPIQV